MEGQRTGHKGSLAALVLRWLGSMWHCLAGLGRSPSRPATETREGSRPHRPPSPDTPAVYEVKGIPSDKLLPVSHWPVCLMYDDEGFTTDPVLMKLAADSIRHPSTPAEGGDFPWITSTGALYHPGRTTRKES